MNAYLTYVCSDNFISGVVALYNSVRLSNCNNDFIVLVTDDVSQESRDILNKKNLMFCRDLFYPHSDLLTPNHKELKLLSNNKSEKDSVKFLYDKGIENILSLIHI